MGHIKALLLWSEEVMDEVYPSLSETDREFLSQHQDEFDPALGEWFRQGFTVEEGAKEMYAMLRALQQEHQSTARPA